MPAISHKEVFVFSSSKQGLLGVYNSYKSFSEQGLKPLQNKHPVKIDDETDAEIIISLLNKGEYNFVSGTELYSIQLRKQANVK